MMQNAMITKHIRLIIRCLLLVTLVFILAQCVNTQVLHVTEISLESTLYKLSDRVQVSISFNQTVIPCSLVPGETYQISIARLNGGSTVSDFEGSWQAKFQKI